MKHVLCHIVILCAFGLPAFAQEGQKDSVQVQSTQATIQTQRTALNAVHLELLGAGFLYSINYERFLSESTSVRIGIFSLSASSPSLIVPLTFSGFLGEIDHRVEIGGGLIFTNFYEDWWKQTVLRLGYRYQPLSGGFNFALTFTPFIVWVNYRQEFSPRIIPWGGISLGWGF